MHLSERPCPTVWSPLRALLLQGVVLALLLAGCASQRPIGQGGSVATVPPPPNLLGQASGRDGPPAHTPAELINQPDPEPRVEPIILGGPNKPYTVQGQTYEPMVADVPWKQQGRASWYGTKFHGRRTSSGELYSLYGLTAAHPTLPIPSYIRVRHLGNGKEVIVRVNDRGPFHSERVLDLSYAAALKLGITAVGSAQVELERLTFDDIRTGAWRRASGANMLASAERAAMAPDPLDSLAAGTQPAAVTPPADTSSASRVDESVGRAYTRAARGYWVQLAALSKREGVDKLQQRIHDELSGLAPLLAVFKEASMFRLQIGPYASREQAQHAAHQVREHLSINPMVIERR